MSRKCLKYCFNASCIRTAKSRYKLHSLLLTESVGKHQLSGCRPDEAEDKVEVWEEDFPYIVSHSRYPQI